MVYLFVIREVLESLLKIVAFVTFLLFFLEKFQDRRSDIELKIRVKSNFWNIKWHDNNIGGEFL